MRRVITSCSMALICAVALQAQETKTTTKVETEGGEAKTVTYSGCVQSGADTKSFVLAKAMPVAKTTTEVGTSGTTSTTTTYSLIAAETIQLQPQVGHQVEITGVMMPAGDSKIQTETKVEREGAPDSKSTETVKSDNAMPQFRVVSVKEIAATCK